MSDSLQSSSDPFKGGGIKSPFAIQRCSTKKTEIICTTNLHWTVFYLSDNWNKHLPGEYRQMRGRTNDKYIPALHKLVQMLRYHCLSSLFKEKKCNKICGLSKEGLYIFSMLTVNHNPTHTYLGGSPRETHPLVKETLQPLFKNQKQHLCMTMKNIWITLNWLYKAPHGSSLF